MRFTKTSPTDLPATIEQIHSKLETNECFVYFFDELVQIGFHSDNAFVCICVSKEMIEELWGRPYDDMYNTLTQSSTPMASVLCRQKMMDDFERFKVLYAADML